MGQRIHCREEAVRALVAGNHLQHICQDPSFLGRQESYRYPYVQTIGWENSDCIKDTKAQEGRDSLSILLPWFLQADRSSQKSKRLGACLRKLSEAADGTLFDFESSGIWKDSQKARFWFHVET